MRTWEEALPGVLERLFARASGPVPAAARPWVDLALKAGPMPITGPLLHDLVVPAPDRPRAGLNVFGPGVLPLAEAWAGEFLGPVATEAVRRLSTTGATWQGGFLWAPDGLRLKLYASSALDRVAAALGETLTADPLAVGIDVSAEGASRFRTYHRPADALTEGWPRAASLWKRFDFGTDGTHGRLTVLGQPGDPGAKRTSNYIFGPAARLASLVALDGSYAWLGDIDRWLQPGLALHPVAYEVDVFADGRIARDALVAVGLR